MGPAWCDEVARIGVGQRLRDWRGMSHLRPGRVRCDREAVPILRARSRQRRSPPDSGRGRDRSQPAPPSKQPSHVRVPPSLRPQPRSLASSVVGPASSAGAPGTESAPADPAAATRVERPRVGPPRHVDVTLLSRGVRMPPPCGASPPGPSSSCSSSAGPRVRHSASRTTTTRLRRPPSQQTPKFHSSRACPSSRRCSWPAPVACRSGSRRLPADRGGGHRHSNSSAPSRSSWWSPPGH